jgi:hypothetical protein
MMVLVQLQQLTQRAERGEMVQEEMEEKEEGVEQAKGKQCVLSQMESARAPSRAEECMR